MSETISEPTRGGSLRTFLKDSPVFIVELHEPNVAQLNGFKSNVGRLGALHPFKSKYHYGSFIIEQSTGNINVTKDLHINNHLHITKRHLIQYISDLQELHFEEVKPGDPRPVGKKFYTLFPADESHVLDDVAVLNIAQRHQSRYKRVWEYYDELPFRHIATVVLNHEKDADLDRNVSRLDYNFSAMNQTDRQVIGEAPINLPKLTNRTDKFPGRHGKTLTCDFAHSAGCITGIGDVITSLEGLTRLNGGKRLFDDPQRTKVFAEPLVSRSGMTTKIQHPNRVEGVSAGLSFHERDQMQVLLGCHVDHHNDSREGHNWNISANSIATFPSTTGDDQELIRVRTNINGYCKACCGCAIDRSNYLNGLIKMCTGVFRKCGGLKLDRRLLNTRRNDFHFAPASLNKDAYYSLFCDVILKSCRTISVVASKFCFIESALEMVYCMAFNPSPSGFAVGLKKACEGFRPGECLTLRFLNVMVSLFGSCSAGREPKRQVSIGKREVLVSRIFRSLHNLQLVIKLANNPAKSTHEILQLMNKSPESGGLLFGGGLINQEILNVLTKLNVITNHDRITDAEICEGTETAKYLASIGAKTKDQRNACLNAVTERLSVASYQAENIICKSFRDKKKEEKRGDDCGETTKYPDTFMRGQCYFYYCDKTHNVRLLFWDGRDIAFSPPEWRHKSHGEMTIDYTLPTHIFLKTALFRSRDTVLLKSKSSSISTPKIPTPVHVGYVRNNFVDWALEINQKATRYTPGKIKPESKKKKIQPDTM